MATRGGRNKIRNVKPKESRREKTLKKSDRDENIWNQWRILKDKLGADTDGGALSHLLEWYGQCTCFGSRKQILCKKIIEDKKSMNEVTEDQEICIESIQLDAGQTDTRTKDYFDEDLNVKKEINEPDDYSSEIEDENDFRESEIEDEQSKRGENAIDSSDNEEYKSGSPNIRENDNFQRRKTITKWESGRIELEACKVFSNLKELAGVENQTCDNEIPSLCAEQEVKGELIDNREDMIDELAEEDHLDHVDEDVEVSETVKKRKRKNAHTTECPSTIKARSYTNAFKYLMNLDEKTPNKGETWQHFEQIGPNLSGNQAMDILSLCDKLNNNAVCKKEKRESVNCPLCGRKFTVKTSFLIHIRIWHLTRYKCKYCEKVISSISHMLQHLKRIHKNGDNSYIAAAQERPLCDTCGKSFRSKPSLRNHKTNVHRKERNFACSWEGCGKIFKRPGHLKVHKRIHTDERPLICESCGFRCRQRNSLNWHLKSKHGITKEKEEILPSADNSFKEFGNIEIENKEQKTKCHDLIKDLNLKNRTSIDHVAVSMSSQNRNITKRSNTESNIENIQIETEVGVISEPAPHTSNFQNGTLLPPHSIAPPIIHDIIGREEFPLLIHSHDRNTLPLPTLPPPQPQNLPWLQQTSLFTGQVHNPSHPPHGLLDLQNTSWLS